MLQCTIALVVPTELIGYLFVNTAIVYITFEDGTGVVLCRVDGKSGVAITGGDAIVNGGA